MGVKRIAGIVLIVVGALLLYRGWQQHETVGSRVLQAIQGSPSNQVIWLLAAGAIAAVVGILLAARG